MRARARSIVMASALVAAAACVPADEARGLGSVSFTLSSTAPTRDPDRGPRTVDGFSLRFERVVLSFKTMTIGEIGKDDVCSYRGRGETADVVFDPRREIVQTFNGIVPSDCPDVGILLGPPGDDTTLGPGVTAAELFELLEPPSPAHAIVDAVATREDQTLRLRLRFDTERTSSRFGGCGAATRGVRVREGTRDDATVRFAAEQLFREAISTTASLRLGPFLEADQRTGGDGVVTMAELDGLPLSFVNAVYSEFYQLPDGTTRGSFGDFVRALFRFTFVFRADGACVGNEPGTEDEER